MEKNFEVTTKDQLKLRKYIEVKKREHEDIVSKIKEVKQEIKGIYETYTMARKLRDINVQRGRVIGRVSLWLENLNLVEDKSNLKKNVDYYQRKVDDLEGKLEYEVVEERIDSILSRISTQMTEWAKDFNLEHGLNPVRLDIKKSTVDIDMKGHTITLQQVGSAKNWLFYHIITYLALHKHFR